MTPNDEIDQEPAYRYRSLPLTATSIQELVLELFAGMKKLGKRLLMKCCEFTLKEEESSLGPNI